MALITWAIFVLGLRCLCRAQIGSTYPPGIDGWDWGTEVTTTGIRPAYLQVIVVGTPYGIGYAGCTTAIQRIRTVACENKHHQTTAKLKAVVAYTELEGE
jgi:hypothetical protein